MSSHQLKGSSLLQPPTIVYVLASVAASNLNSGMRWFHEHSSKMLCWRRLCAVLSICMSHKGATVEARGKESGDHLLVSSPPPACEWDAPTDASMGTLATSPTSCTLHAMHQSILPRFLR
eukprot:3232010-Amphidinium_carterae.1